MFGLAPAGSDADVDSAFCEYRRKRTSICASFCVISIAAMPASSRYFRNDYLSDNLRIM